jgi:DNA-binding NarL/FixJ family response regulator
VKLAIRGNQELMNRLRVLVVDDQAAVRFRLRAILKRDPRFEVVGEAVDGLEACAQAATLRPEIVIMDVSMPVLDGAEATRRLLTVSPASSVIALTAHEEPPYVREMLDAGARGYVLKHGAVQHLVRAIEVVIDGGLFLDPALPERPVTDATPDPPPSRT